MRISSSAAAPRQMCGILLALLCAAAAPACESSPGASGDTADAAEPAGDLHFRMVTRFGFGGSMYHDEEFFFLMPGGRIYRGLPPEGLESFDYETALAEDPGNTGTYVIDDGMMKVQWADGSSSTYEYRKEGDGNFSLDGLFTGRVRAFPEGQTLSGTWSSVSAAGGGGAGVSSSLTLTLRPDGTFEESSLGTLAAQTSAGPVGATEGGRGAARYRLAGNTLVLEYADGTSRRLSIFPFGDDAASDSPEMLNINGRMLTKEEE